MFLFTFRVSNYNAPKARSLWFSTLDCNVKIALTKTATMNWFFYYFLLYVREEGIFYDYALVKVRVKFVCVFTLLHIVYSYYIIFLLNIYWIFLYLLTFILVSIVNFRSSVWRVFWKWFSWMLTLNIFWLIWLHLNRLSFIKQQWKYHTNKCIFSCQLSISFSSLQKIWF